MTKKKSINEEEVCIDAFVHYLECMDKGTEVAFHKEENDPPDYWIKVNGSSYAVEVTSIAPDINRLALCRTLHESVKAEFAKESGCDGIYAINVKGNATPPKRNSKEWKSLVSGILRAIQSVSKSKGEVEVFGEGRNCISVSFVSDGVKSVGLSYVLEPEWEIDVIRELANLMNEAINMKSKNDKLRSSGHQCDGIILLLYDAYGYADADCAVSAFSHVSNACWLHSVFWVTSFTDRENKLFPDSPGRTGFFLASENTEWLR